MTADDEAAVETVAEADHDEMAAETEIEDHDGTQLLLGHHATAE